MNEKITFLQQENDALCSQVSSTVSIATGGGQPRRGFSSIATQLDMETMSKPMTIRVDEVPIGLHLSLESGSGDIVNETPLPKISRPFSMSASQMFSLQLLEPMTFHTSRGTPIFTSVNQRYIPPVSSTVRISLPMWMRPSQQAITASTSLWQTHDFLRGAFSLPSLTSPISSLGFLFNS